jgi:hypothetical protein
VGKQLPIIGPRKADNEAADDDGGVTCINMKKYRTSIARMWHAMCSIKTTFKKSQSLRGACAAR